ncbi:threonyl-tRNA synthetase [Candidatus Hakubella thermalkaliphila]|uniref:Threonine--tRNA ligase n=1 Tax=Candidatus Hakubella thermalkaliphila TaxID=2754717 RepID=A0A6V8PHV4_9ACTN|nr:Threonine--tRNA ligase 2 [Actinomycetota bacterium]GFP31818.1 threonyl-tRNA synthetase [Candidatus Hakubella thermalkaliphila]GFP41684.1 threonyl-tRNA synthetase [Candidatus Hakubella thermalkaliphila]
MVEEISEDRNLSEDKNKERPSILRHSASHVMAQAVQSLYPQARLAIGPAIEDGFYYDFDLDKPLSADDLARIEIRMRESIAQDYQFARKELPREKAIEFFKKRDEPYKVELIQDIGAETVSIYRHGDFVDLCTGPHLDSTGQIKAFKLLSVAGAYWRGDVKKKMLQRIYGTAFFSQEELDSYLDQLEEARKRDHRKMGRDLDLFSFHDEGPGFPFLHPKGMVVVSSMLDFWREEHKKRGYVEVRTPIILNKELWIKSGHWEHYKENMYFTKIDEQDYAVKPMNCPGHNLIYKSKQHSYRELPIRMSELGLVHRHELSGVLHGLLRVRAFIQDDAHIYCLPEQVKEEVIGVIDLVLHLYRSFGFSDYHVELSTKPEKCIGSEEMWADAEGSLQEALKDLEIEYKLNPGEGAFYGPKIDFHIRDCMGRSWQCGTVQLDFAMPERFDLDYVGEDGCRHRPVMIHRALLGSIERFLGILLEHYAGALPLWLSPVQVRVMTIGERFSEYARKVERRLKDEDIQVEVDDRNESIAKKVRDAQVEKIPYMVIIGENEVKKGSVSVRTRFGEDKRDLNLEEFLEKVKEKIGNKVS